MYDYDEVWGGWVKDSGGLTTSVTVTNGSIQYNGTVLHNIACDVFVTAYAVDMTTDPTLVTQPTITSPKDMSENYYGYPLDASLVP
jgi:hypothetical protein